jgi:hypothetical protein
MAVQNLVITAGGNDGYGHDAPTFNNDETTAFYGDDGSESVTYLRFLLTADLAGATIDSAFLIGYMQGSAVVEIDVAADDTDDPAAPTSWATIDGITLTTAKVKWTTLNQGPDDQTAPDIKTVIQELVDSYTMANGDALVLLLDPRPYVNTTVKEINTFESTETEPRLNITYTIDTAVEVSGTLNGGGSISALADQVLDASGVLNGGGSLSASVTQHVNQTLRPASTVTAGDWDTAPTGGQSLDGYTSDESDATWIEDTTV